MNQPVNRFDTLAATWDDDPAKVETARAAAASLSSVIPITGSGWTALEIGSGTGLLSRALAPELGAITLIDTSEQMTLLAAERVSAVTESHVTAYCIDLTVEEPTTGPYDLAYSLLALHHIDDVSGVLRAVHRLLRPGGYLGLLDLDHDPDGSFHRIDHGHSHQQESEPGGADQVEHVHDGFTTEQLRQLLDAAGFAEISVTGAEFGVDKGEPPRTYPILRAVARRAH